MERKKGSLESKEAQLENAVPKFRWKVLASSGFRANRRIYKPNEIFVATESEIPAAFRDLIVKVDAASVQEQNKPLPGKNPVYTLEESKEEEGLWNVLTNKGKVLNEKPLEKDKAEKLLQDLSE